MPKDELSITEITVMLRAISLMLQTIIETTPTWLTHYQPVPGEWSINEVIGHLIEGEQRGFAGRIRRILTEEHHTCITWDQDAVARARHDNDKSAAQLLAEFTELRQQSVDLVLSLQPDQLQRQGQHPHVGVLSVRDLLYEWLYHDRNHLKQIESNIGQWLWPQMNNAQRFYTAK